MTNKDLLKPRALYLSVQEWNEIDQWAYQEGLARGGQMVRKLVRQALEARRRMMVKFSPPDIG